MKTNEIQQYSTLLKQVKQRVLYAQQRAIYAANEELLRMYWDLGKMLSESQQRDGWGKGTLELLSKDLKNELLKDPYIFDMLTFTEEYDERDKPCLKTCVPVCQASKKSNRKWK